MARWHGLPARIAARIDVVIGVDEHDGYLRFAWRMQAADGSVALKGTDFGEVDGEGTLRRIVGFRRPAADLSRAEPDGLSPRSAGRVTGRTRRPGPR